MTIFAPIQQHIDALAGDAGYPAAAVDACLARPDQAAPPLRAVLGRAARGTKLSDAEVGQLFVGLHILAKLRDTQSFQPLMRLLRRPFARVDDLLGDVVTASLAQILASLFDGDDEPLFEIIADASFDEYLRDAVWHAVIYLTFDGRIERERLRAFILRFDAEKLAPKGDMAWIGWLDAIADLGFDDIAAVIGSIWIDQRLPVDFTSRKHFDADLAAALRAPGDASRFSAKHMGTVDDVETALSWANWDGPPAPIVNPMRDVGRNDPCPCGSGKKAKKCCLASVKS